MSMQLSVVMIFLSVIYLYNYVNMTNYINFNRPLPSSGNPHFQNEAKCTAFLVLCLHENEKSFSNQRFQST